MPRRFAVLLVVFACGGKKEPPAPAPASGTGSAIVATTPIDAAAIEIDAFVPTGPIELLHNYGGRIQVSSHVKNNAIKPEHLADKDFNTAWNSQTGQLAGAWIDVSVSGAMIHDIRMTVDHTGKGPKGEDYFTMNPRITKVSILHMGKVVMTVGLDPNVRELQTITLPKPTAPPLRIRVEEVTMGTKTNWREVCVSEIEAWGMPAADTKLKPGLPFVYFIESDLPKRARVEPGKPIDVHALCDAMLKPMLKDFRARGSATLEDPGPDCEPIVEHTPLEDAKPWIAISMWRISSNTAHGPKSCRFVASTDIGDFFIGDERGCGPWEDEGLSLVKASVEEVTPGGTPALVVRYLSSRDDVPVHLMVCRVAFNAVQCTKSYEIETATWKVAPRFSKGMLHLDLVEGKPPAESMGVHSLNFDH